MKSGATALHSAVGRSLVKEVELLLRHGARKDIVKMEVWYFRCCMPWKWCGRNWYQGKSALAIAEYKVKQKEDELKRKKESNQEIPDEEKEEDEQDLKRYKQVLELLKHPPPIDHGKGGDIGRTNNEINSNDGIELVTKADSEVVGNEEENLALDMVMDDVDIEPQDQDE